MTTNKNTTNKNATTSPISLSASQADQLAELLEICDDFLRNASPTVRTEMRRALIMHDTMPDDFNLLVDCLGFTASYLRARLARDAHQLPAPRP
jgi:hypothetical protein